MEIKEHPCETIYRIGAENKKYGDVPGTCRITGKQSTGLLFNSWIRDTFTDHAYLLPGNIISNEALFCFNEASEIIQQKTNRDKLQRFRTYSHIVSGNKWYCFTKSDKREIFNHIISGAELVCLTDSGQKHMLFKHRPGMWQLDESFIIPNIPAFTSLHTNMCTLLDEGFSQTEIITGNYLQYRIMKVGFDRWKSIENLIKPKRGTQFFNFTSWLLFTTKSD